MGWVYTSGSVVLHHFEYLKFSTERNLGQPTVAETFHVPLTSAADVLDKSTGAA